MTASAILARRVGLTYPARDGQAPVHALGPVDLSIREGEFLSVVGPSGCGKSTLLSLVAGLLPLSEGVIEVHGKPVQGVPPEIGVIFQQDASFPWLTVRDNVAFPLRANRLAEAEVWERVDRAVSMVGLGGFADSYPSQLSGGMRQRVCLARTLVTRPRIILMDEPFAALDAQTRLLMGDELLALWRESGATVMLITHALDEAALLSDRIAVMSARPGRIIEVLETGWPADRDSGIAADPRFGALTARLWGHLRGEAMTAMGRRRAAE